MDYISINVTFDNNEEAEKCVQDLLEKKLVSCCQLFPIKSKYRWKGKIETSEEICVMMKSKKTLFKKIKECILTHHSYDIPEIITYSILDGHRPYLKWIDDETDSID